MQEIDQSLNSLASTGFFPCRRLLVFSGQVVLRLIFNVALKLQLHKNNNAGRGMYCRLRRRELITPGKS